MPRPLAEQVIVITGASSGIGRETAQQLARHGASLVLVARNEAALQETAAEVEAFGGRALVAPADVSDPEQVQRVADLAANHFGRIDTWVNGAAVSTYSTVEQTTIDEIRRIIEVDLLGTIYGIKAALPYLRRTQRHADQHLLRNGRASRPACWRHTARRSTASSGSPRRCAWSSITSGRASR